MYKKIGILGGLTPESTVTYYMHIVHRYHEIHGDHGYPECIILGVSFQKFEDWMGQEDWDSIEMELLNGLRVLEKAGADFSVIATNTMHILFDELQEKTTMPLISIIDTTAEAIQEDGMSTVGLLGTRFTMNKPFYREGLEKHGIEVIIPEDKDREYIQRVIFEELSVGKLSEESRKGFLGIIDKLVEQGDEGIVLGCTEIPLLVRQADTDVKIFDTAVLHADKALKYAIK
jgi:aspartate racemase